ncbi:unnamed protein product [Dimorphilus gyrociliatus]|uniref:Uncharacterized protein n=1 Tax=Dimorphilus gyrociliatus TaxID=2664684 RepID=A0A7I8W2E9_9ANNE|nr:unnamed protein product [Dimorphilus gyrociliatus]
MIEMERRVRKEETAQFEVKQMKKENLLRQELEAIREAALEARDYQLTRLMKATINSRVESIKAEMSNKLSEQLEMVQKKMRRLEAQAARVISEQETCMLTKQESDEWLKALMVRRYDRRKSMIPSTPIMFEGEPNMFEGFIVRHESIVSRYSEAKEWEKFELLYMQLSYTINFSYLSRLE